ncbi:MAG: endonuclease/exonuclease/phosphatase family protein [Flavobacteriales bacterium]|nr:endonuclease/exonuclease/phosphatase family protein [Flavobacteriales bacterium]
MQTFAWVLLVLVVVTTAASLLNKQRWWVRMFDLPRAQMIVLGVVAMVLFAVNGNWGTPELVALTLLFISDLPGAKSLPLHPVCSGDVQARGTARQRRAPHVDRGQRAGHEPRCLPFLRIVEQHDPDLVLTLESDAWWENALEPLERSGRMPSRYRWTICTACTCSPASRLTNTEVRYLVEDDVPSIRTTVVLPSGAKVTVHGVHPRPPAPGENDTAKERDAELLLVARNRGRAVPPSWPAT